MIKNIEDLKNIQIVCRNQEQVKDCLNYLEQLGFNVFHFRFDDCCIIFYENNLYSFCVSDTIHSNLPIEFFNKELVKTLQKFIKEEVKEKKEEVKDFEVVSDGRITKINNQNSQQKVYIIYGAESEICNLGAMDKMISLGLLYATAKARDRAMFKMEIETKLKNIAERLNNGWNIDWDKGGQCKYFICYDFEDCGLCQNCDTREKHMGQIYCLNIYFLEVAKKEIGEENLIKYFKEDFD